MDCRIHGHGVDALTLQVTAESVDAKGWRVVHFVGPAERADQQNPNITRHRFDSRYLKLFPLKPLLSNINYRYKAIHLQRGRRAGPRRCAARPAARLLPTQATAPGASTSPRSRRTRTCSSTKAYFTTSPHHPDPFQPRDAAHGRHGPQGMRPRRAGC